VKLSTRTWKNPTGTGHVEAKWLRGQRCQCVYPCDGKIKTERETGVGGAAALLE